MSQTAWRSLRTRIVILAAVTCIFILIAAASFYRFLRSSQAASVQEAQRHLVRVGSDLALAYAQQEQGGLSLLRVPEKPLPPHSPHHQKPEGSAPGPPPPPPPDVADLPGPPVDPLSLVTSYVLQPERGIEGGFLAGQGPLVGYAFPTHEGPGSPKEMPQRERPTILQLARDAESSGTQKNFVYEGPHDVVLFFASPIREPVNGHDRVTGAVWLMQRLPDLHRGHSRQLLLATAGFGCAAVIAALLAWFVLVEVRGGVNSLTQHLSDLSRDLSYAAHPAERPKLIEFRQVMEGIDSMAHSLQGRIASERELEAELRHKERLSSLGQFAAGVAHELRNPLATIRLRTQMAQDGSTEEPVVRSSRIILEEVDRLDSMIGKLLSFSRPISLEPKLVDLCELCASLVDSWKTRVPEGVVLTLRCPPESVVVTDRGRLLQVLDNLVENAVQALRSGTGEVAIDVSPEPQRFQVQVADTGIGFSQTALNHAFDPFFTTKDTGTGLGLSIAFEMVQALNGEVRAANRPDGGAVVTVLLPRTHLLDEVTTT